MFWPRFRRTRDTPSYQAWWRQADDVSAHPSNDAIQALRASMAAATEAPDEADRQAEFLEGLERLRDLHADGSLPEIPTQHRVIAADRCHFIAPVTLEGPSAVAGKLFLTSNRAIFVSASVTAWPWHRVRAVVRQDRDVALTIGGAEGLLVRCNTYGEALEARFIAAALAERATRSVSS